MLRRFHVALLLSAIPLTPAPARAVPITVLAADVCVDSESRETQFRVAIAYEPTSSGRVDLYSEADREIYPQQAIRVSFSPKTGEVTGALVLNAPGAPERWDGSTLRTWMVRQGSWGWIVQGVVQNGAEPLLPEQAVMVRVCGSFPPELLCEPMQATMGNCMVAGVSAQPPSWTVLKVTHGAAAARP